MGYNSQEEFPQGPPPTYRKGPAPTDKPQYEFVRSQPSAPRPAAAPAGVHPSSEFGPVPTAPQDKMPGKEAAQHLGQIQGIPNMRVRQNPSFIGPQGDML